MRISDWSSDVCSSDLTLRSVRAELLKHVDESTRDPAMKTESSTSLKTLRQRVLRFVEDEVYPAEAALDAAPRPKRHALLRSEEHTSELQSLMRISYAVFCLKKKISLI